MPKKRQAPAPESPPAQASPPVGRAPAGPPSAQPIGLALANAAKRVSRAFDDALAQAGGSRPTWLILLALKAQKPDTHKQLAEAVGIEGATLTHHLNAMERSGLVSRERLAENRRVQRVELTPKGERTFLKLRDAAMAHDARLREGLSEDDLERTRAALARMQENVEG
jgi:MarR family transcriptional regulator for hemolysin